MDPGKGQTARFSSAGRDGTTITRESPSATARYGLIYLRWVLGTTSEVTWHETGASTTQYSEHGGTVSITGAVNLVTVTHELIVTPDHAVAIPQQTGFGDCWVDTFAATTFNINFTNQPGGATWYFDWRAWIVG